MLPAEYTLRTTDGALPSARFGGRGSQVEEAGEPGPEAETAQTSPHQVSRVGASSGGSPAAGG